MASIETMRWVNLKAEFGFDEATPIEQCVESCLIPMLPRGSESAFRGLDPRGRRLLERLYSPFTNPVYRYPIAEPPALLLGYDWSRSGVKRLADRIRRRENLPQLFAAVKAYQRAIESRWRAYETQEDNHE